MKSAVRQIVALLAIIAIAMVSLAASADAAPAEVCPEEGKVESIVDGDLDDIVLPAGTEVCIFGASIQVNVTADGESTLRDLLGLDKNVSHYTITEEPPSTTTTTQPEETTTTTVPPTTTTSVGETTTTERSTTTTTPAPSSTTTPEPESTITSTSQPSTSTSMSELPYTGAGSGVLALYGAILSLSGLSVLAWVRREA